MHRIIASIVIASSIIGASVIARPHHRTPCVNECNEIRNARAYADWCGGFVQVIDHDVTVTHCDE